MKTNFKLLLLLVFKLCYFGDRPRFSSIGYLQIENTKEKVLELGKLTAASDSYVLGFP